MAEATLRVFRGDSSGGQTVDYRVPVAPGMVVLDALHYIQGRLAPDLAVRWNCKAGKCGSCSAEVNGRPRLTCKTRMDDLPQDQPIIVLPMKSFPRIKDLVTDVSWNYRVNRKIPSLRAPQGSGMENFSAGCRSCPGVSQMHRMLPLPKRLSRSSRKRQKGTVCRPTFLRSRCRSRNASARRTQPRWPAQGAAWPWLLQYHEVLHGGLSRGDSHH